jgi:putative FmdB family regulatory protein
MLIYDNICFKNLKKVSNNCHESKNDIKNVLLGDIQMPIYEYEHTQTACQLGQLFEIKQSIHDEPFSHCPECGAPVKKRISLTGIVLPKTNTEIRDMGLTKLVKRDDGVYENVTRRDNNEHRYMEYGKPETMPNLNRIISD